MTPEKRYCQYHLQPFLVTDTNKRPWIALLNRLICHHLLPVRLYEAFLRRNAVFGFVNESPHGTELVDVGMRVTADIAADAEQQFITMLSDFFEDAIVRGEIQLGATHVTPQLFAELLVRSSVGLKANEMPRERFHQRLGIPILVFVAGIASNEV